MHLENTYNSYFSRVKSVKLKAYCVYFDAYDARELWKPSTYNNDVVLSYNR